MAELDWKEVRRYLGLGPEAADAALEARLRDSGAALTAAARPRSVWRRFPLELGDLGDKLLGVVNALFALLALLGVVNDPTTQGAGDSQQALGYQVPKGKEE